jgi:hypothetical protein
MAISVMGRKSTETERILQVKLLLPSARMDSAPAH